MVFDSMEGKKGDWDDYESGKAFASGSIFCRGSDSGGCEFEEKVAHEGGDEVGSEEPKPMLLSVGGEDFEQFIKSCLLYTSPSPRDS